jgi:hypothetical protein
VKSLISRLALEAGDLSCVEEFASKKQWDNQLQAG